MIAVLARAGRLLAAHWPALLAWFVGGTLAHDLLLRLASLVGVRSALGGILLLPLAALALLVAYVAMLLVLRDGMPGLRAVAGAPPTGRDGRRAFLDALLGGILPFVAFYAAWGYIAKDVASYINGATEIQFWERLLAAIQSTDYSTAGTIDDVGVDAVTITIVVVAYAGRWLLQRFRTRLPVWTRVAAVYLEALWVYLAAYIIADLLGSLNDWVQTRQAMVWLGDLRAGLTGWLAPLGVAWDGIEWLLGEAGGLILLPVAWLTIAGVVYGQAVKAQAPALSGTAVARVRSRYGSVPARVRRRLGDFWGSLTGRFRPIGGAIVLMWRAGPVLIGGFVLLFTLVDAAEQWLIVGVSRAIGPHELTTFWIPASVAVLTLASFVIEPLRMALIGAAYDRTLGELIDPSPGDAEAEVEGDVAALERAELDVVPAVRDDIVAAPGEEHGRDDVERARRI